MEGTGTGSEHSGAGPISVKSSKQHIAGKSASVTGSLNVNCCRLAEPVPVLLGYHSGTARFSNESALNSQSSIPGDEDFALPC